MTQEEKSLLLKDLCARFPYGVKTDITYNKEHGSSDRLKICSEGLLTLNTDLVGLYIEDEIHLMPYLRPISSMTEEEKKEYRNIDNRSYSCPMDYAHIPALDRIDWLNKKMFDYRGLIEKNLALEAPEGMYK